MRTPGKVEVHKRLERFCIDSEHQDIASMAEHLPNAEANAQYMALAWNCHDTLVEALEAVRAYCIPGMNWTDEVGQALLDLADKALALAKEAKP